jgi:hypothetical protein
LQEERDSSEARAKQKADEEVSLRMQDVLNEIQMMREARLRQDEMILAVVRQRDLYKVLLQQANPGSLPSEASGAMEASSRMPTIEQSATRNEEHQRAVAQVRGRVLIFPFWPRKSALCNFLEYY